jgi:hypothetical protein
VCVFREQNGGRCPQMHPDRPNHTHARSNVHTHVRSVAHKFMFCVMRRRKKVVRLRNARTGLAADAVGPVALQTTPCLMTAFGPLLFACSGGRNALQCRMRPAEPNMATKTSLPISLCLSVDLVCSGLRSISKMASVLYDLRFHCSGFEKWCLLGCYAVWLL